MLSGEFVVVNKFLLKDLIELGLWNPTMKKQTHRRKWFGAKHSWNPYGAERIVQNVWEIKQKTIIDMAAERGAFICQSQSLNLFMAEPNLAKLTSMHFHAWKSGLKTGMYYLRTKAAVDAIKFTVDTQLLLGQSQVACSLDNPEECLACGS